MSPNADIIRMLIIQEGLGETSGDWTVYVGFTPSEGDKAITIFDTAGKLDGRMMRSGEQIEHPGVQVQIRSDLYWEALDRSQEIAAMLDAQYKTLIPINLPGKPEMIYELLNVSRVGGVVPIGVEDGDNVRHYFTVNAILTVRATN